jgi:hypothetical protein
VVLFTLIQILLDFLLVQVNFGIKLPTIGDVNDDGQTEIGGSLLNGRVIIYQSSNIPWFTFS